MEGAKVLFFLLDLQGEACHCHWLHELMGTGDAAPAASCVVRSKESLPAFPLAPKITHL